MAIFPQGLTQIDQRCTPGERRVLHQLKRCLGDDYLVWHDIPIGPKARQPDFVILSPRWGVLLLEVKDWKRASLLHATRDAVELQTPHGRVTQPHPMRQARGYAMELADCMQRDPLLCHQVGPFQGKLLFPYGWGVVMQGLRAADVHGSSDFAAMFPPARTLLRDDLDEGVDAAAFQRRLWGMFTVSYPCTLSLPQRDRIRWHLFPEVRLQQQATLDFDADAGPGLPDLLQVMDLQQEQIARSMGEGHRVIHGAAGSGKTMILIYRAQVLAAAARADQPVLVLCFNRTLAGRIDALLRQRGVDERVQVRTFHGWCADLVDSYQLDLPQGLGRNARYEAMAGVVERAVDSGRVPGGQYAALLIDEAHDFEDAWLRIARRMVSPHTNSLLVLYDDAQSIYQKRRRKFNFASVGIEARGRTSVLRLNYRNTAEVMSLAVLCAQELLQGGAAAPTEDELQLVQPASAGRHGAMPVLIEGRDEREEAELLAERIAAAHAAGTPLGDIAVLCRARTMMPVIERALSRRRLPLQSMATHKPAQFDWRRTAVRLLTLHSAKGLEFPLVFVAGLQALPMRDESVDEALRLLYVGMTRATHELVLSAHGHSPVVQRVKQALGQVARQFSVQA